MLQEFVDTFEPHHLLIQLVPKPHLVAVLELLQSELKYAFWENTPPPKPYNVQPLLAKWDRLVLEHSAIFLE